MNGLSLDGKHSRLREMLEDEPHLSGTNCRYDTQRAERYDAILFLLLASYAIGESAKARTKLQRLAGNMVA